MITLIWGWGSIWPWGGANFLGHGYEDPVEGPWWVYATNPQPMICSYTGHDYDLTEVLQSLETLGSEELQRANHEYIWSDEHVTSHLVPTSVLNPICTRIYIEVKTYDELLVGREEFVVYETAMEIDGIGFDTRARHESIPGLARVIAPARHGSHLYWWPRDEDFNPQERLGRTIIYVRFDTAYGIQARRCRQYYRCTGRNRSISPWPKPAKGE